MEGLFHVHTEDQLHYLVLLNQLVTWFLKIAFVHEVGMHACMRMCVYVCVHVFVHMYMHAGCVGVLLGY